MEKMNNLTLLKLICVLVFLGWMIVWIVLPMEVFKYGWLPNLSKTFNPTYIGGQGVNLFFLTFPVMMISVLGCIYLHLKSEKEPSSSKSTSSSSKKHLAILRRPLLVMGPLGVVTATELVFLIMGIALVCWHFGHYYYVSVKHPFMGHGREHQKKWQIEFRSISLRIGYASNISWAFVFFPVIRLSSLLPLVGLTSESSIKYHIWIGQVVMITSALHSAGFVIYWAIVNQLYEMVAWSNTHVSNLAGNISWVFLIAMWVTSFAYTRRKTYEVFFYTHQLYILATFFYVVHIGVAWTMQILPGIFLFTLDRYLRFLQSRTHARLISVRVLPGGTMEMTFSKSRGLQYNVTSSLFVSVPKISTLQWHPFTVSSNHNMEPDKLSIVFKIAGSWTTKLYKELSSSSLDRLEVAVEGPYGPSSASFLKHETLVLISGGSGITPYISIIREVIHQSNTQDKGQVPKILLVCAFKHAADLTTLDLLLPAESSPADLSNIQLEIQAYVTREDHPPASDSQNDMVVQTKWFKPSPLDSPITPVLGHNSWLYLCFITASSFVLFLVLLGLVTQYHIYPIDKGTNKTYDFTIWVLWDVFLMCISIIFISSIVFLKRKRTIALEEKQIMNVEVPTPVTSPGSWLSGGGGELESLPYQSLVQATQVHYGGRPDLQKILLECKGGDIGVMASGPRGLRHDVARVCSGCGATNLHFEYLSFNW